MYQTITRTKVRNSAYYSNVRGKLSNVSIAIFEDYLKNETEALKKRLERNDNYLNSLYKKSDFIDDPEKQKTAKRIDEEMREIYANLKAVELLKEAYTDHYQQLFDRFSRVKEFADYQFRRADHWFSAWERMSVRAGQAETLLSFLTPEEREDLEERRDNAQIESLLKSVEV